MFLFLALVCDGCSNKQEQPAYEKSERSTEQNKPFQLDFYERRLAKQGENIPPPILKLQSGTLAIENGCLILEQPGQHHALVFEKGFASFDPVRNRLKVGAAEFAIGDPISVGGPFNSPSEDFDPVKIQRRCNVRSIWPVTR
jgi:hypothetical protein